MRLATLQKAIRLERAYSETDAHIAQLEHSYSIGVSVAQRDMDETICDQVRPALLAALSACCAAIRSEMETLGVDFS